VFGTEFSPLAARVAPFPGDEGDHLIKLTKHYLAAPYQTEPGRTGP
jgi:hypothetical protein